jgi:hypothetical protein
MVTGEVCGGMLRTEGHGAKFIGSANAAGSDGGHGRDCIDDSGEQRECSRFGAVVAASLATLHDEPLGPASESGFRFVHAANLKPDVAAGRSQTR